jgi:hypothetical protein
MDESVVAHSRQIESQLRALVVLQEVENQILERQARIKQYEQQIEEKNEAVRHHASELQRLKQAQEKIFKDRRETEVQVKSLQEAVGKLGLQMYDVKTNDAFKAIQIEIKSKKEEIGRLEERILEMMMNEDNQQLIYKEEQGKLKEVEQSIARDQQGIRQAIQAVQTEVEGFKKEWDQAASKVNRSNLDTYLKLRDARGGRALAKIENDICTGCRIAIRPQAKIELRKYKDLLRCDNCARILYTDD